MSLFVSEGLQRQAMEDSKHEFVETRSVTLEWYLSNLKHIFESSKGDGKSKCIKSALFDDSKWQLFFYANSGSEKFCSLFLSCEPTAAERERGLMERNAWEDSGGKLPHPSLLGGSNDSKAVGQSSSSGRESSNRGPWRRDGVFKFSFELRSVDRRMTFKAMEAHDHSFSDTARNWGYQQVISRNDAYFGNAPVRLADAFLIICTIVSSPTPPSPPPLPRLLIPKDLVTAYASLFDDPQYSDVCFVIRSKRGSERRLYAARKLLQGRCDYFDAMFTAGFNESNLVPVTLPSPSESVVRPSYLELDDAGLREDDESVYDSESQTDGEETNEEEDEFDQREPTDTPHSKTLSPSPRRNLFTHRSSRPSSSSAAGSIDSSAVMSDDDVEQPLGLSTESNQRTPEPRKRAISESGPFVDASSGLELEEGQKESISGDHEPLRESEKTPVQPRSLPSNTSLFVSGTPTPKKDPAQVKYMMEVVVKDAEYATYRALIFWLYTDSITFAPLASTYHAAREAAAQAEKEFKFETRRDYVRAAVFRNQIAGPCSAKAIYRLADKIGLRELKERASEYIIKSLTVQNIPYEVFGSFAMQFDDIRRVEVAFLCERWNEVRNSAGLKKVIGGLRKAGRYPGFEEVWARILPNLEYRPSVLGSEDERS